MIILNFNLLCFSTGQLFSSGWNTKGQLGLGSDIQIVESFTGVELPKGTYCFILLTSMNMEVL